MIPQNTPQHLQSMVEDISSIKKTYGSVHRLEIVIPNDVNQSLA